MTEKKRTFMQEASKQAAYVVAIIVVLALLSQMGRYIPFVGSFTNFFRNPVNLSVFAPFIGAVVLLFFDHRKANLIRGWALFFTLAPLFIVTGLWLGWWSAIAQRLSPSSFVGETMLIWARFVPDVTGFTYLFDRVWIDISGISIHYITGLDGLSFPLFLLTAFIGVLACISSFGIKERVKEYFVLYLLLVGGMMGVFAALDYFLFYVFWEISLVPMYFLIGIWGGPRRLYAAIKFFLYTLFGSVFMLIAIIVLFLVSGMESFSMIKLNNPEMVSAAAVWVRLLIFGGFFLAFSIKVPLFPFHTWLPDAHVEAPTPISVILAGILLKMGAYGFLRVLYPTFPDLGYILGAFIGILAVISIIYGALVAMVQPDLKKLVAYSSVSHMGFIILGIASMTVDGYNGAIMQMIAHGLGTGALFMLVGVVYDRTHTRMIKDLSGLMITMPRFGFVMYIAALSSLGLPGLVGFWGEFLIIKGTFTGNPVWQQIIALGMRGDVMMRVFAVLAAVGIVLTAGYILWMIERIMLGREHPRWKGMKDMVAFEYWSLVPIAVFIAFFGVYPAPMFRLFDYFSFTLAGKALTVGF